MQGVADLVSDHGFIGSHVGSVVKRFGNQGAPLEEIESQAASFLLERYHIENFDARRFPKMPDESVEDHRERVNKKLRAHAGVSLRRHLVQWFERRHAKTKRFEDIYAGQLDLVAAAPEADEARQAAKAQAEKRIRSLDRRLVAVYDPNAMSLRRLIHLVLSGSSVDDAFRDVCRGDDGKRVALLRYARKHF